MLRINLNKINFSLAVVGFVREGTFSCPDCGCKEQGAHRLYGSEGKGRACDTCGTPLKVDVVYAEVK